MVKCQYCHRWILPFQKVLIHKLSGKILHKKCFGERENAIIQALKDGNIKELERIINDGKKSGR